MISTNLAKFETDLISAYDKVAQKGGTMPQYKNMDNLPAAIESMPAGVENVATSAEMDAKKITGNIGKMFHYVGTTTADYVNGRYYLVIGGTATVDLAQISTNYVWQASSITISGLDPSYQFGPYESANKGNHNTRAVCKINIKGLYAFSIWLNSYAESNYDYSIVSTLDAAVIPLDATSATYTPYVKGNTKGFQKNPETGLNATYWRKYTFDSSDGLDGGDHFIYVVYRKDNSVNSNNDRGYFVYEVGAGVEYKEFLAPEGNLPITANGSYDVTEKQGVTVNVPGIIPSGDLSITENGSYNVSQYETATVNVSGGGGETGFKLYVRNKILQYDELKIKINGAETWSVSDSSRWSEMHMIGKVTTLKLWGADHIGTYPSESSSWARYRAHGSTDWTNISLTREEANAQTITLTSDTDLELLEATCLNKGTLVLMADGTHKPVEEIEPGDYVLGYDGKPNKVRKSQKGTFAYGDDRDVWRFEDGHEIITTYRHEFYNVEAQRMRYLDEWKIGEHAYTEDGKRVALVKHIHEDTPCRHFSLWCENENYFAGGLLAGNRYTGQINI